MYRAVNRLIRRRNPAEACSGQPGYSVRSLETGTAQAGVDFRCAMTAERGGVAFVEDEDIRVTSPAGLICSEAGIDAGRLGATEEYLLAWQMPIGCRG
jgi:hypothetical protein